MLVPGGRFPTHRAWPDCFALRGGPLSAVDTWSIDFVLSRGEPSTKSVWIMSWTRPFAYLNVPFESYLIVEHSAQSVPQRAYDIACSVYVHTVPTVEQCMTLVVGDNSGNVAEASC